MSVERTLLFVFSLAALLFAAPLHAASAVKGPGDKCYEQGGGCSLDRNSSSLRESGGPPRPIQPATRTPTGSELPGGLLTMQGELDGTWDYVEGKVVFTYDASASRPDVGSLQVLIRAVPVTHAAGSNRYSGEWDRSSYWLDFDGDGPDMPRLLPVQELSGAYVPQAVNDPYPDFANDANVVAECTVATPCSIQLSEYVLLREPGVDYSAYQDEAASTDLVFVANHFGQAIAAVLDVYNANHQFVRTKHLVEDDQLKLSVAAFKLSDPDHVYMIDYTEFVVLEQALRIELKNYVPGVDFQDTNLAPDLQAGQRQLKLLLEGWRDNGANDIWGFGGPYNLGFTWAEALDFLHQSSFEALRPAPNAGVATIVQRID